MRLSHLTKFAAVASVIAAPVAFSAPASYANTNPTSSAYGIAATGLVAIPPLPAVSSSGQPVRKSVVELPANPLLKASVLSAAASGTKARASVVDLKLGRIGLSAHVITAKCVNGRGASQLTKVVLNGKVLKTQAAPNSAVTIGLDKLGAVSLVINKQARDAQGRLTVTALELSVPLGPGKVQTVSIASATCGAGVTEPNPPGDGDGTPNPNPSPSTPGAAPVPTPVTGDLPVTG